MKITWKTTLILLIALAALVTLFNSFYTVREKEYACVVRFSKIEYTKSEAGLYLKLPFVDSVTYYTKAIMLYDINSTDVITADKKMMMVDSYIMWQINDPVKLYESLGSVGNAESRIDYIVYSIIKNIMSETEQSDIINQGDAAERNGFYKRITELSVKEISKFGIDIVDIKIKRLDLPADNERAVYERMVAERHRDVEDLRAEGNYEASVIRNEVDKTVNTTISDAKAAAAKTIAEGETKYLQILAEEVYNTPEKIEFYEFTRALEALKKSFSESGSNMIILGKDSPIAKMFLE